MPTNSELKEFKPMKNNLIALNENELNEVTGGVNLKEVRDTAIIATCTTVGSVLGDIASTFITTGINVVGHHCEILEDNNAELYLLDKHGRKKLLIGHVIGLTAGAAAGATVGKAIVNFLNRK